MLLVAGALILRAICVLFAAFARGEPARGDYRSICAWLHTGVCVIEARFFGARPAFARFDAQEPHTLLALLR